MNLPMTTQQRPFRRANDKRFNKKTLALIKRPDNPPLELEMDSSNKGVKIIDHGGPSDLNPSEPSLYNLLKNN